MKGSGTIVSQIMTNLEKEQRLQVWVGISSFGPTDLYTERQERRYRDEIIYDTGIVHPLYWNLLPFIIRMNYSEPVPRVGRQS